LNQEIAQTNSLQFANTVKGNYHDLIGEFSKLKNSVDYYEQQAVPEANSIIEQSTLSYKNGAMDYIDYILNVNQALEIKQNYLDALNNHNQTIISIEYITGKIF
jgi:heavy metal efflux system protein